MKYKIAAYVVIGGIGVIVLFAFTPNFAKLQGLQAHYSILRQKLILEEKINYAFKKEFDGLSHDPEYIEKVARTKLGWCRPTETVYRFQSNPSTATKKPPDS